MSQFLRRAVPLENGLLYFIVGVITLTNLIIIYDPSEFTNIMKVFLLCVLLWHTLHIIHSDKLLFINQKIYRIGFPHL